MLGELTDRQRAVFEFIAREIDGGIPPTLREIGDEFGFASPNAANVHVEALRAKGWVTVYEKLGRGLRLTAAAKKRRGVPVLDFETVTRLARLGKW